MTTHIEAADYRNGRGMDVTRPNFEPAVQAIIATFAVFVGFTLEEEIKKLDLFDLSDWNFWAFIAFAALLLRYIVGSAVHLNYVYVQKITVETVQRSRSQSVFLLFKDLFFLLAFGLLAIYITKAPTLQTFVNRLGWFLLAGLSWAIVDWAFRTIKKKGWDDKHEAPGAFGKYWAGLDVIQLLLTWYAIPALGFEPFQAIVLSSLYIMFLLIEFYLLFLAAKE